MPSASLNFLTRSAGEIADRLGCLDFDPVSKTYLPSIRTAVLATWRDNGYFRDGTMLAAMERLAEETGGTSWAECRSWHICLKKQSTT